MPRYIDADALIANLDKALLLARTNEEIADLKLCKEIVRSAPTISSDELRGVGKWEKDSDGLDVCSECGEVALQRVFIKLPDKIVDLQMVRSKFCPSCGARMGG